MSIRTSSSHPLVALGDVLESISMGPFGSNLKVETFRESGVPVLRGGNLAGHRVDDSDTVFVTPEKAAELSRSLARPGDIVITHRGTLGQVSLIPRDAKYPEYLVSQSQLRITPDANQAASEYITYWLHSRVGQQQLLSYASQTGVPAISQPTTSIKCLQIPLPPLETQRAIAEVLGALDGKIAANRRTIDTADSLRAAIWDKATRDAHHVPLSSLAAFINGGAFTKGASGNGRPVIRIVEMNQGVSDATVRTDLEVKDDQVVRAGDFLMSWSGSLTTSRWFGEESILNQHIFKVIPAEGVPLWAVASAVETKMPYFQFVASNKATTMGHIQRHHLDEDVAWPTVTSALNLQGTALWDLALAAERENQVLASTRDELLPLLMSGRITVGAASSHVEEVV